MQPSDLRDTLARALAGAPGVVSAYLFGSAAVHRMHAESDVDVAVLLDRLVFPSDRVRFEQRLALMATLQALIPRRLDLVILNDLPPQFARRIMVDGVRLFTADAERDHAHLRMVLSRAADLEPFLRRTRRVKLEAIAP